MTGLVTVLLKNDIMFMYLLCIYKKPIFKIDTLNFTMYVLMVLTCLLKTYVIRLHDLISVNIFYTIKDHSFPKTNKLKKPCKNSDFFKSNFNKHFFHYKEW